MHGAIEHVHGETHSTHYTSTVRFSQNQVDGRSRSANAANDKPTNALHRRNAQSVTPHQTAVVRCTLARTPARTVTARGRPEDRPTEAQHVGPLKNYFIDYRSSGVYSVDGRTYRRTLARHGDNGSYDTTPKGYGPRQQRCRTGVYFVLLLSAIGQSPRYI